MFKLYLCGLSMWSYLKDGVGSRLRSIDIEKTRRSMFSNVFFTLIRVMISRIRKVLGILSLD